ncbi:hypothetical protein [Kordia jejudonensis]|uniref:hypothetical protein n=1 Tax=Kordia jejudonensis TaxID=1348245 RepID=UPI0006299693|nr:hypothetical protein [Kordia jejudonensis]
MALEPIDNFDEMKLGKAAVLTANWRKENVIKAFLFHKNDIECLAQEEGVVGVRFYIGITTKENGEDAPDMIAVGVNDQNEDIINETSEAKSIDEFSGIYDFALPCPELCDPESILFKAIGNVNPIRTTSMMKTVQHSTENECFIKLGEISEQEAVDRVSIWQCEMNKELISIYFNIEDLDAVFNEFTIINEDTNALRVYFGLEDGVHRVILIGATNSVNDYYSDIDTPEVYVNTAAPCTGNGEVSCAVNRILYTTCTES